MSGIERIAEWYVQNWREVPVAMAAAHILAAEFFVQHAYVHHGWFSFLFKFDQKKISDDRE